jgi:CheY-like chemotaxis protein
MMAKSEERKKRVLVAEDVSVISHRIRKTLESRGFVVEVAQDGEQCLQKVKSFAPDLLILDLMMPKVHGIDILKALRADTETDRIGVIVCTSKDFTTEQRLADELGAFDVITKPFQMQELLTKVERFFSKDDVEADRKDDTLTQVPKVSRAIEVKQHAPDEIFRPVLETSRNHFCLWGTRGSIPVSGPQYMRHGGNTSCMTVTCGEDIIIFDAGSGIRNLGLELSNVPRKLYLFITHTHWDHIQGFPFFKPASISGFDITIYGAKGFGKDLKSIFRGQLDKDYFPVQMEDLNANLDFKVLDANPIEIESYKIFWAFTNHPGATVGYKIEVDGKKIGWIPDNEFLEGYLGDLAGIALDNEMVEPYRPMIQFISDIDILVTEAQYTNAEYPEKIGWGHTCLSNACLLMKLADVKRWIVTHHDPLHDDTFLQDKLNLTRQLMQQLNHSIDVSHGYDGLVEFF